jgi:hypothetical protein
VSAAGADALPLLSPPMVSLLPAPWPLLLWLWCRSAPLLPRLRGASAAASDGPAGLWTSAGFVAFATDSFASSAAVSVANCAGGGAPQGSSSLAVSSTQRVLSTDQVLDGDQTAISTGVAPRSTPGSRMHELSSTSMQFSLDEPGLGRGGDEAYMGKSLAKVQSRPSELQRTNEATARHDSSSHMREPVGDLALWSPYAPSQGDCPPSHGRPPSGSNFPASDHLLHVPTALQRSLRLLFVLISHSENLTVTVHLLITHAHLPRF